ncbi:hypothetical protein PoB_006454800 [Plakobranchus ocellatus]|uniref:Uncharacterized protein n=1 Tax=Plakobranchus ocellatus TaxID=259542 RepID=A0AAV4D1N3_9GAST|nr:hypothetical protein PoB_006454800 [Plakobranchus ocellatus]
MRLRHSSRTACRCAVLVFVRSNQNMERVSSRGPNQCDEEEEEEEQEEEEEEEEEEKKKKNDDDDNNNAPPEYPSEQCGIN